jgi:preprotein translocase subunit SecF
MLRILHGTRIDFIRLWRPAAIFIAVLIIPAIILMAVRGFDYSIEFTGGTLVQTEFAQAPNIARVRSALSSAGLGNVEISTFGSDNKLQIRAQGDSAGRAGDDAATHVGQQIRAALDAEFGPGSYTVARTEDVGPKVGAELRQQAAIAMIIAFALTLVYLAWRFESRFAAAAVIATIHDIIATLAFMQYLNIEISLFVVGGILTVIGYSMNDKVVVFDRVRENLHLSKKESLYDILNRSVNETLPRTIMTGTTTLASLLALIILGGEVIRPFALVLTFGILIGTFSSIYVAAPVLLWIERKWPRELGDSSGLVGHGRVSQAPGNPTVQAAPPAPKPGPKANPRPGPVSTR